MDPVVSQQLAESLANLITRVLNQTTVPGIPGEDDITAWKASLKFVSNVGNESIAGNKLFLNHVAIGLDGSNHALGIFGAAGPDAGFELYETSTGTNKRLQVRQEGAGVIYNATFSTGGNAQQFQVGNQPALTINSDRRVAIGEQPSFQGRLTLVEDTNVNNYVWLRHNFNGSQAYTGYVLNSFGNSWAIRMGSMSANANALEVIQDVGGDNAKRLVINTAGNVGIGTTSPSAKLSLGTGLGKKICVYDSGAIQSGLGTDMSGSSLELSVFSGAPDGRGVITFGGLNTTTSTYTERMRIASDGSLLLSTADQFAINYRMYVQAPNPGAGMIAYKNFNETACIPALFLNSAGSVVGSIQTNQNSTAYNTSSDYRLKEDWVPVSDACQKVMQLNPVNFAWKLTGQRVDGFLAHELAEVVPEAVTGEKDAVEYVEVEVEPACYQDQIIPAELDEDGNVLVEERIQPVLVKPAVVETQEKPVYQGIDQAKLVPLLTAALQEAIERLQVAHDRIDELEQRIIVLEDR